jgi:hypothetical protein
MSPSSVRFVSFSVVVAAASAILALGACGDAPKPTDPNTPGITPSGNGDADSGTSTDVDSGTTPDSGTHQNDGGTQSDGGSKTDGGSVLCGTTTCTGSQQCCFLGLDAGSVAECRNTCPGAAVGCDDPTDCSGSTPLCCFTAELRGIPTACFPASVKSVCESSCPLSLPATGCAGMAQGTVCKTSTDCTGNGQYTRCCPLKLGNAATVLACQKPSADGGC